MCFKKYFLIIILLFFSSLATAEPVKFAQITDVHLSSEANNKAGRMKKDSVALLEDVIMQVNAQENMDFVVFTGDSIDRPDKTLLEKFINTANKLKVPWYFALGNHDVDNNFRKKDFLKILGKEKTYYSFKINDFLFIFMDGTLQMKMTANSFFTDEEFKWLEEQLCSNKDKYAVIFQHYPLVEPFSSLSHRTVNYKKYLNLLDKHDNVVAVISGHYHANRVQLRNNVAHISTSSLIQYPNAFRIITLENIGDDVFIKFRTLNTNLKDVRIKRFNLMRNPDLHAGKYEDRNGIIKFKKPL